MMLYALLTVAMAYPWKTAMLSLLILHHCVPLASAQMFETEPRDAEVLLGNPVTIACRVPQTNIRVSWTIPVMLTPLVVGTDMELPSGTPERMSVQGGVGSGDFSLVISQVRPEDAGRYICHVVLVERGDIPARSLSSEPATLTVVQLPPTGNPVCWIREGRVASVGDTVSLRCGTSDLTTQLTWYVGDIPLSGSIFTIPTQQGRGIDNQFLAESSANRQTFTCQPNNGQYEACEVMLDVRHPPIVTIESDEVFETGVDARFACKATGNPANFAYTWHYNAYQVSFQENPRFNRARLEESGSVLVLPDLDDNDNNVTLRCEAVNAIGASTESHVIRTQPGKTLAQIIGPILLGIILGLVLIVLVLYGIWWRRQRRKVKQINKKKSVKRSFSKRGREEETTTESGIVYTQTLGGFGSRYGRKASVNGDLPRSGLDLESAGYGPDVTSIPAYRTTLEPDKDDGGLRPIPRRKSSNSLSNGGGQIATTSDEADLISPDDGEKSFTYFVNPNFDELRNSAIGKDIKENDLNPEEEKQKHLQDYNINEEYPEKKLTNDDEDDDNIVSTEL